MRYKITVLGGLIFLLCVCITNDSFGRSKIRNKNLYNLTLQKHLKGYLADFKSDSDIINPQQLKDIFKEVVLNKNEKKYEIVPRKQDADVYINAEIISYRYLEEDPTDQIVGGTTGLIVDFLVKQNYAETVSKFEVYRVRDNRRLWSKQFKTSVTKTAMPEADAIPLVLHDTVVRFLAMCFGEPRQDNL